MSLTAGVDCEREARSTHADLFHYIAIEPNSVSRGPLPRASVHLAAASFQYFPLRCGSPMSIAGMVQVNMYFCI